MGRPVSAIDADDLRLALDHGVQKFSAEAAAIDLLDASGYGHWIRRMAEDLELHAVRLEMGEDGELYADVDWSALGDRFTNGELIGSPGENAVMQVALALAGYPMALNGLQSLDANNIRLVLAAVAQAAGRPEVLQP